MFVIRPWQVGSLVDPRSGQVRRRLQLLLLAGLLLGGGMAPTAAGQATAGGEHGQGSPSEAPGAPALILAPARVSPGGVVLVTASGFLAGEAVVVGLDGAPLASGRADAGGRLPVTGIVVPAGATAGTHRVVALGQRSGRRAAGLLTVLPLSPTLRVVSGRTRPGAMVAVHGAGFLPREAVALAINGAAINAAPAGPAHAGLSTAPDGTFDAAFPAPQSLLAGLNTLSATGSSSHLTASARLIADLPIRSDFFFAGGIQDGRYRPVLAVLNAGPLPATLHMQLIPEAGARATVASLTATVGPYSRASLPLAGPVGARRRFGLRVQADRRIAAQLLEVDRRGGAVSIVPVGGPRSAWLLAEGFTGLTFRETLTLLNPGAAPARAQLGLLRGEGYPRRTLALVVPAQREVTVDVNRLVPRSAVAAVVNADRPLVVSRTLRFGAGGGGMAITPGTPLASTTWLFAQGSTRGGFRTFLTVLNPGPDPAEVTASFYDTQGRPLGSHTVTVGPQHRGTLELNRVLAAADFATFATSSVPVVVERPLYLGDPNGAQASGTDLPGSNGASPVASFADGATGAGQDEDLQLLNPTAHVAQLAITFYPAVDAHRAGPLRIERLLPPLARITVRVGQLLRGTRAQTHGVVLQSLNGVGFVAEQSIITMAGGRRTMRSTPALVQ